ncbi:MAG: hypothetical protein M3P82_06300 [Bacteroidota bacterium]|nr:hypothetical protein [Bacteroidota bacterium]
MKTIAIVTPKIDTFSNPTLILLFEQLIEKKYKILFFGFEQLFIPKEIRKHIELYQLPFNFYSFYRRPYDFIKLIDQYCDIYKVLKIRNKVEAIVCVDPMGLVIAGRIKKLLNLKIIYASFEIFFEDEFYIQRKKIIKTLETKYSEIVDLVIIQDKKREELLKAVNNFSADTKFLLIPVSPKKIDVKSNEYDIYNHLNIPRDKKLVISSGTLQKWSGINELLNLFPDHWDNDFWLVIHSHYILDEDDELKKRINTLIEGKMNISFHNQPFYEYEDYAAFLSKCHIGIAVYFPNTIDIFAGKNIQEIGLSSGKFSTYMMLGIPAITTSNSLYKILNEKYDFGGTINEIDDIPRVMNEIKNNYDLKVKGCKKIYDTELDPLLRIDNLVNHIDEYYNKKIKQPG